MSTKVTNPETPSHDVGLREDSLIWYLLNDNSLIEKAAAALCPEDFSHNKRDKLFLPNPKSPDGVAGRFRAIVYDAIANREARTLADVVDRLSSKDNSHDWPVAEHLVQAFRAAMLELSGDDSESMFPGEPISDSFESLLASMVSDKRVRDEKALATEIASLDVTKNVALSLLSKRPQVSEYLIDGIFAKGQAGCGFGGTKIGKTSLLGVDLAYSLANCVKFLGHFNVPAKRRVLFLSGESGIATLTDAFIRCCKARDGKPETDFEGITLSTWLPRFGDAGDLAELEHRAIAAEADVVIVDPAGPCMSAGAASTLAIAYAELRGFSDACLNAGATPLLLHHSTKGANTSAMGLRAAAGAGFGEWARQWMTLDRIGRFDPATGLHKLRFTAAGSAGHSGEWIVNWREGNLADAEGRCWDISVKPVVETKTGDGNAKVIADAAAIVEAMKAIGTIETARAIRTVAKINGVRADAAFAHLLEVGTIATREFVKAHQNCKGYELCGDDAKGVA